MWFHISSNSFGEISIFKLLCPIIRSEKYLVRLCFEDFLHCSCETYSTQHVKHSFQPRSMVHIIPRPIWIRRKILKRTRACRVSNSKLTSKSFWNRQKTHTTLPESIYHQKYARGIRMLGWCFLLIRNEGSSSRIISEMFDVWNSNSAKTFPCLLLLLLHLFVSFFLLPFPIGFLFEKFLSPCETKTRSRT